ncbi:MAG: hypothetical protein HFACDABA_00068 [Anaerolineales bacterium]|nr:hypothetical protein [Anaerolineales bacterium]
MEFSKSTKEHLGYYVYALVDPRDKTIFYVGKASANNRAFNHLQSNRIETKKQKEIKEIRRAGYEPNVEILRYGLDNEEMAFEVEAAIIDAVGLEHLTNVVRGHGIEKGRMLASEIERLYGSSPKLIDEILEPCILFFIYKTYSPTLSEQELYDCTRQFWGIGKTERESLRHRTAFAIVDGVAIRAYRIESWHSAGSTFSSREFKNIQKTKWEFVGQLLNDHPLVGRKLIESGGKTIKAVQKGYTYLPRF